MKTNFGTTTLIPAGLTPNDIGLDANQPDLVA